MSNLARRQPKQLELHSNGSESGHGNDLYKAKGSAPGIKRKLILSFLSGTVTMGAFMFLGGKVNVKCWQDSSQIVIDKPNGPTGATPQADKLDTPILKDWKWYEGDVNQYYNELEKDLKRDPKNIDNYAVHRWMGTDHSTQHHYELIHDSILRHTGIAKSSRSTELRLLDAGCGLGASMMWFERKQPNWKILGRTLSEEQVNFVKGKLPQHNFEVELRSYDDLDEGSHFDVIYSIEAMIHSPDIHKTLSTWAKHLDPQGALIIIDDFLMPGADRKSSDLQMFEKGWMANSLYSVNEINEIGRKYGIELVESRDLLAEYRVVELNYKNSIPKLLPEGSKNHQGWIGSKLRQKLTVEGKLGYNMIVFRRIGARKPKLDSVIISPTLSKRTGGNLLRSVTGKNAILIQPSSDCLSVPTSEDGSKNTEFDTILPKDECISSWYCCDKAQEYLANLKANRTHKAGFLKMDTSLFGNYMTAFARHLQKLYESMPTNYTAGRFLDIGGTGSTVSGMKQVTTKFQHFSGPLEYWMLDSDTEAKSLYQTIHCDICDCPEADSCGFDVTFSHTVLEHAARPHQAFDTIARLTKKGGLTMHLVPWSYQYHATPDDYYRFSHSALKVLMEDRGFEPLEIGYDLCSKPEKVLKERVDEHFDFIWLTYVIARKKSR